MRLGRAALAAVLLGLLLAAPSRATTKTAPPVDRIAGVTRYETAARVAQAMFPDGSPTAVVASGTGFADALAAGVAASALHAPLLLASAKYAPVDALDALGVTEVIVIGGTGAIPDSITAQLGPSVRRIAGADRYATASLVADEVAPSATHVLSADGDTFASALVAAVHAARIGARLELTHGGATTLDGATIDGDVNAALLQEFPTTSSRAIVTTISSFADALSATVLAGTLNAPVLFTVPTSAGESSVELFESLAPSALTVVGGTAAVPDLVLQQLLRWAPLPPVVAPGAETKIARDVFDRMNAERAARGIPALVWDDALAMQAIGWAHEMASTGFRHSPMTFGVGENIHHPTGYCEDGTCYLPTSGVVHRDLMHASDNRDNVLDAGYWIAGVGVFCGPDGTLWAVERFSLGFSTLSPGGTKPTPIARDTTDGITCAGTTVGDQPWWPAVDS